MAISELDSTVALVVIDMQNSIVSSLDADTTDEVIEHVADLVDSFRSRELPVVLVNVVGSAPGRTEVGRPASVARPDGWSRIIPELEPQPDDILITKVRWGAFHETTLHDTLQDLGVTQLVITGIATSMGVESTARQAHENGYNVVVVTDAVADSNTDAQKNSIKNIFPKIGETAKTEDVIELLQTL